MVVFKQYTDDRGRQADAHTKQKKCLCYTCSVMLLLKVQNKRKSTEKYIYFTTLLQYCIPKLKGYLNFLHTTTACAHRPTKSIRDLHPGGWDSSNVKFKVQ
jgi:hypothetical protein